MKRLLIYLLIGIMLLSSFTAFAVDIPSYGAKAPSRQALNELNSLLRQSPKNAALTASRLKEASSASPKSDRHLYRTGYLSSSNKFDAGYFTLTQPALVIWEMTYSGKNLTYGMIDDASNEIMSLCADTSDFYGDKKTAAVYLHPGEYFFLLGYDGYSGSFRYDAYVYNIATTVNAQNNWNNPLPLSIGSLATGLTSATNVRNFFKIDMPYSDAVTLTVSSEAKYTGYGVLNSNKEYINGYSKVQFDGEYGKPQTKTLSVLAQEGTNYIGVLRGKCTETENIFFSLYYQGRYTAKVEIGPTSITINNPSDAIALGESVQLTTTTAPSMAVKEFTWSSSDSSVATVSNTGLVTGVASGTATITATARNGRSQTIEVKVAPKIAERITLSLPTGARLAAGIPLKVVATVYPQGASERLSWKSSNTKIVDVSDDGTLTAHKKGSAKITATAQDAGGVSASLKVTAIVQTASITIKGKDTVKSGKSAKYKVKVLPASANIKKVIWTTSDASIATITPKGVLKAASNSAGKTVIIAAAATDGSGIRAEKVITIA